MIGNPPKQVTPKHIDNLTKTTRIVVKLYGKKHLLQEIEFSPKDLQEYSDHLQDVLKKT